VRPERLELPTYWFEAIDETAINDLDGVRQREVEEYYQSVSLMGVALRITPSVQVVGIPVGIPGTKALDSGQIAFKVNGQRRCVTITSQSQSREATFKVDEKAGTVSAPGKNSQVGTAAVVSLNPINPTKGCRDCVPPAPSNLDRNKLAWLFNVAHSTK